MRLLSSERLGIQVVQATQGKTPSMVYLCNSISLDLGLVNMGYDVNIPEDCCRVTTEICIFSAIRWIRFFFFSRLGMLGRAFLGVFTYSFILRYACNGRLFP